MERESLSYANNTGLSQACLLPFPSESQHSGPFRLAGSGYGVTPPAVRQPPHARQHGPAAINPASAAPQSPAAGFRHSSFSYSWILGGKPHVSQRRTTACAAQYLLLGRTQQQQPPQHLLPSNQNRDICSKVLVPAAVTCCLEGKRRHTGASPSSAGKLAAACCSHPSPGSDTRHPPFFHLDEIISPLPWQSGSRWGCWPPQPPAAPARVSPPCLQPPQPARCPLQTELNPIP